MLPITVVLALGGGLVLGGCGKPDVKPPAPTVQEVGIITVESHPFALTAELPGRTAPYLIAEVRPQVGGIIQKRAFTEGGEVKSGALLYQIDPAIYRAAYDSARAALARADANAEVLRQKAARYADLVKIEAVSRQDDDDVKAALKQADADVIAARAAADKARIDLDYTQVKAPVPGRIGRSAVTPGALVTASQTAALATIQQLDPIYVDLNQSSAELLRLRRDLESGRLQGAGKNSARVRLLLEDGTPYQHEGKLAFTEVSVDQTTGSVTLRAVFPNPEQQLLPGMYVRAVLEQALASDAITVPHKAVSRTPRGGAQAMVVNAENRVEARALRVDHALGDRWLVTDGLKAGDRVIVDGLQKVRPGAEVRPVPAAAPADAAAAPSSAPAGVR